jgi:hypothetical protein
MVYATGQRLAKECLFGTREKILEEIIEWIHRPSDESVPCTYWLHGVAGCGKSAIASTIAQRFENMQRCAWYFFDASRQTGSGPEQMFSTLSRTLADIDAVWRESLVKILKPSRRLQKTVNVKEQFDNFFLEPAKGFQPLGPIVVVIDALDESGSKQDRAPLLQMLARLDELGHLGHFRFLITSRPEQDIQEALEKKSWVISKNLTKVDETSTDSDIRRYVNMELSQVRQFLQDFDREQDPVDVIVSRAEHLFQWAFVACSYIRGTWEFGVNPVSRYKDLRDDRADAHLDKIDELYTKVLKGLYGSGKTNNDKIALFRKVLGRILSAREPLSFNALTKLWPKDEDEHEIGWIVCSLGSFLKGVSRDNRREPIQPLHASFIDFLTDPNRSREFYINAKSENATLALSTLRVMNDHLRFNICNLETSYVRNRDVENLSSRVQENIPEYLAYACRYFADHLGDSNYNIGICELVHEFLKTKFLFWLEALSLLKNTLRALEELLGLQTWVKVWVTTDNNYNRTKQKFDRKILQMKKWNRL